MFENLTLNINQIWNSISSYMSELSHNPFKLLTLLLDLAIVIYLLYKLFTKIK